MGASICPITSLYNLIYNEALTATRSVCETHSVTVSYCFLDKLSYAYGFCLFFFSHTSKLKHTHSHSQYCNNLFPVSSFTQYKGQVGPYTLSALPRCQCTVLTHRLTAPLPLWGVYITFLQLLQALCALYLISWKGLGQLVIANTYSSNI